MTDDETTDTVTITVEEYERLKRENLELAAAVSVAWPLIRREINLAWPGIESFLLNMDLPEEDE